MSASATASASGSTLNEPWCSAFLGHAHGRHAPGIQDDEAALRAAHHLLLGHGMAVRAMRERAPANRFGLTLNLTPTDPASDDPADVDAARRIDALANRLFLDPVLLGRYPDDVPPLPVQDGDAAIIAEPLDVLGVNYYFRQLARAGGASNGTPSPWVGSRDVDSSSRGLRRPRWAGRSTRRGSTTCSAACTATTRRSRST